MREVTFGGLRRPRPAGRDGRHCDAAPDVHLPVKGVVTLGLVLLFLATVWVRAAHPHALLASPIWCDGIDDPSGESCLFVAESKKDDATPVVEMQVWRHQREQRVALRGVQGPGTLGHMRSATSLSFCPKLCADRCSGSSESPNPH
jgi:hypothetical protein